MHRTVNTGIPFFVDGWGQTPQYMAKYFVFDDRYSDGDIEGVSDVVYAVIPVWDNAAASNFAIAERVKIEEEREALRVDIKYLEVNGRRITIDPEAFVCGSCSAGHPTMPERRPTSAIPSSMVYQRK